MSPAFGQSEPEFGFCPFISASFPVAASGIQAPGGGITGSVSVHGACLGPKCRLWDGSSSDCSLKNLFPLPDVASSLQGIENQSSALAGEMRLIRRGLGFFLEIMLANKDVDPARLSSKKSDVAKLIDELEE